MFVKRRKNSEEVAFRKNIITFQLENEKFFKQKNVKEIYCDFDNRLPGIVTCCGLGWPQATAHLIISTGVSNAGIPRYSYQSGSVVTDFINKSQTGGGEFARRKPGRQSVVVLRVGEQNRAAVISKALLDLRSSVP